MITIKQKGDFSKTIKFVKKAPALLVKFDLDKYGDRGVKALQAATPVDTGETASSWQYKIEKERDSIKIIFENTNIENGIPIALLLQYGHGTKNGGYVQGRDYINPSVQPIFDDIVNDMWKEMISL